MRRLLFALFLYIYALAPSSLSFTLLSVSPSSTRLRRRIRIFSTSYLEELQPSDDDDDDEEEEEEDQLDPYRQAASSEFLDDSSSSVVASEVGVTSLDWGGALGKLRQRVGDVESGVAQDPSHALFRLMSSESPNQAIGSFVQSANPQVVQAMSGAISSLLGGLSNPVMGAEMLVKASTEKIGSLCFQLQMTGYMFRNAEYVIALKDILQLRGEVTLEEYKEAFDRMDTDGSGYIETSEVKDLLDDIYEGQSPAYEVDTFIRFFDTNNDGRISWREFERGLGVAMSQQQQLLSGSSVDEEEEFIPEPEPDVSGTIEIELEDGGVVEVEAKEYIKALKEEAQALKKAIRKEQLGLSPEAGLGKNSVIPDNDGSSSTTGDALGDITGYIASRQGDLKSLTEGISPEIVETMKKLVDFVLEGGESGKGKKKDPSDKAEMVIPGSALQQLALWQLILGYRLREAEATGDYLKLLE